MASLAYHLVLRLARRRRARYAATAIARLSTPLPPGPSLPLSVVTYCSGRDFPELVLSWRSFLRHAGRPSKFLLVSDGSITPVMREALHALPVPTEIRDASDFLDETVPMVVHRYAAVHPFGKKLAIFLALHRFGPVLYSDSDVLYFPAARTLAAQLGHEKPAIQYLLDCVQSLDQRLLRADHEALEPLNAGLVYLRQPPAWPAVLERLESMAGDGNFFTEQTSVHLAARLAGAQPFPPSLYVLQIDDQWSWRDRHAARPIVLRHYVNPVRYKMWLQSRSEN